MTGDDFTPAQYAALSRCRFCNMSTHDVHVRATDLATLTELGILRRWSGSSLIAELTPEAYAFFCQIKG